jgi:hypothetical protein
MPNDKTNKSGPPAKPPLWTTASTFVSPRVVKQADPDIILFNDDAVSPELLIELQFEDIGGLELINIARSDMIDGQDVIYSPVKQLARLRSKFNPNNIISTNTDLSTFFSRFAIDLILRGISKPYFDEDGNLVIEIEEVLEDEFIQAEIDTSGKINRTDFS